MLPHYADNKFEEHAQPELRQPPRIAFIGNSLTLHGPSADIGWPHDCGMAASGPHADYVHLLLRGLGLDEQQAYIRNFYPFETDVGVAAGHMETLRAVFDSKPPLIVIQLGDNVGNQEQLSNFAVNLRLLVAAARRTCDHVYCVSTWWRSDAKDDVIFRVSQMHGARYVYIGDLYQHADNIDRQAATHAHAGVAAHPQDWGMARIAERLALAIQSDHRPEIPMMTTSLDLGCGARPRNPFHAEVVHGVGTQAFAEAGVAQVDLTWQALPFADNRYDYLSAYDVLARMPVLPDARQDDAAPRHPLIALMNEAWRVLKPGGHLLARMPAWPHSTAAPDGQVCSEISLDTFTQYFGPRPGAAAQGFTGAFELLHHEWQGGQLQVVLRKVAPAPAPAPHPDRISVFIPVYNGVRYLAQTLESVLGQTHADFEVLCIDDGSTDGSLALLEEYAARDTRIRLLRTPANLGTAPRALNFGLPQMTGAWFVYSSQDDLFSPDWLASMHARALATGADAVLPDVVMHYPDQSAPDGVLSGLDGDRSVHLSGREAALHSLDWRIPGNALWRAGLVRFIGFAEFGLNSDEYSGRQFFINAGKVTFCDGRFYYRQDNADAVTKKTTVKTFDYPYTQLRLYQLLAAEGYAPEVLQQNALRAVMQRNQLQQWLQQNGPAAFTPEHIEQAQQKLDRCTAAMRHDPMFAAVL